MALCQYNQHLLLANTTMMNTKKNILYSNTDSEMWTTLILQVDITSCLVDIICCLVDVISCSVMLSVV